MTVVPVPNTTPFPRTLKKTDKDTKKSSGKKPEKADKKK
jgi:hypothetical protein